MAPGRPAPRATGDVVVLDEFGRTDFDKLHARAKACQWKPGLASVVYCVFEVLVHRGTDIRHQPLRPTGLP